MVTSPDAVYATKGISITDDAKLYAQSGAAKNASYAIICDRGNIQIAGEEVTANAGKVTGKKNKKNTSLESSAVYAWKKNITISGSKVTAKSNSSVDSDAILSPNGTITIENSDTESGNDDFIGSAKNVTINTGDEIKGTLSEDDKVDFYKFTLPQGSIVTIEATGERKDTRGYGNYSYEFFNSEDIENELCWTRADFNSNLGYLYNYTSHTMEKGTYYIKITHANATLNGTYNLKFKTSPWVNYDERAINVGTAADISLPGTYQGIIRCGYNNDKCFYKIATKKPKIYSVTIKDYPLKYACREGSIYISLCDARGEEIHDSIKKDGAWVDDIHIDSSKKIYVKARKGETYLIIESGGFYNHALKYKLTVGTPGQKIIKLSSYKKKIKAYWETDSSVTGYQIRYSTKSNLASAKIKTVQRS